MKLEIVGILVKKIFIENYSGPDKQKILDQFDKELQYNDSRKIQHVIDQNIDNVLQKNCVIDEEDIDLCIDIFGIHYLPSKDKQKILRDSYEINTAIYLERIADEKNKALIARQITSDAYSTPLSFLKHFMVVILNFAIKVQHDRWRSNRTMALNLEAALQRFNATEEFIFQALFNTKKVATIYEEDVRDFILSHENCFASQPVLQFINSKKAMTTPEKVIFHSQIIDNHFSLSKQKLKS